MVRTFWENKSNGQGRRLVRETVNARGYVDAFEVVFETRTTTSSTVSGTSRGGQWVGTIGPSGKIVGRTVIS